MQHVRRGLGFQDLRLNRSAVGVIERAYELENHGGPADRATVFASQVPCSKRELLLVARSESVRWSHVEMAVRDQRLMATTVGIALVHRAPRVIDSLLDALETDPSPNVRMTVVDARYDIETLRARGSGSTRCLQRRLGSLCELRATSGSYSWGYTP